MTDDGTERIATAIARLKSADAFDDDRGGMYWTAQVQDHLELWVGDQTVTYIGYEWLYGDGDNERRSRTGAGPRAREAFSR
ncbi:hypothetical protein [Microbacterium lacticum]|uniref:hypothetical protein n=1 Tax=Microbacterium lacticum TaxID=33885 RepID=UPI001F566366|nr:hypothetical protein [Microbacterium lacticum]